VQASVKHVPSELIDNARHNGLQSAFISNISF
jgi:hypothetical protein